MVRGGLWGIPWGVIWEGLRSAPHTPTLGNSLGGCPEGHCLKMLRARRRACSGASSKHGYPGTVPRNLPSGSPETLPETPKESSRCLSKDPSLRPSG